MTGLQNPEKVNRTCWPGLGTVCSIVQHPRIPNWSNRVDAAKSGDEEVRGSSMETKRVVGWVKGVSTPRRVAQGGLAGACAWPCTYIQHGTVLGMIQYSTVQYAVQSLHRQKKCLTLT